MRIACFALFLSISIAGVLADGEPGPDMETFWDCVDRDLNSSTPFAMIDSTAPMFGEGQRMDFDEGNITVHNIWVWVDEDCVQAGNGAVVVHFGLRNAFAQSSLHNLTTRTSVRLDTPIEKAHVYSLSAKVVDYNGNPTGVEFTRSFYFYGIDRFVGLEAELDRGAAVADDSVFDYAERLDEFDAVLAQYEQAIHCEGESCPDPHHLHSTLVTLAQSHPSPPPPPSTSWTTLSPLQYVQYLRHSLEQSTLRRIRSLPPLAKGHRLPQFSLESVGGACGDNERDRGAIQPRYFDWGRFNLSREDATEWEKGVEGEGEGKVGWGPVWQGYAEKEMHRRRTIAFGQPLQGAEQGADLLKDRGVEVGDDWAVKARKVLVPKQFQDRRSKRDWQDDRNTDQLWSRVKCTDISSTMHCKMRNVVWQQNVFVIHSTHPDLLETGLPKSFRPQMKVQHEPPEPKVFFDMSDEPLGADACDVVVFKPAFFIGSLNFPHYGHTLESTMPLMFDTIAENSCLAFDLDNLLILTNMASPVNATLGHFHPLFASMTSNPLLSLTDLHRLGPRVCFHDVTIGLASTVDVYVTPPQDPDRSVERFNRHVRSFVLDRQVGAGDALLPRVLPAVEVAKKRRKINLVLNKRGAHARNVVNNEDLVRIAEELGIETRTIHFEGQSFTQNVLSLQDVTILAGPYGSPCSNFILLPPGSVAIHFTPYGLNTHRNLEFSHLMRLGPGHIIDIVLPFESSEWIKEVPPLATANLTEFWETDWLTAYNLFTWGQQNLRVPEDMWRDALKQAIRLLESTEVEKFSRELIKDEL